MHDITPHPLTMKAHLQYLKYVLIHKLYVYRAGRMFGMARWRLLVHDLSKFLPSEWFGYVHNFYGQSPRAATMNAMGIHPAPGPEHPKAFEFERRVDLLKRSRKTAFDVAWLKHQHRNPHHWQHWVLRMDDGSALILAMPEVYVYEMVSDWIGAGTKILKWPSLFDAVFETAQWYGINKDKMQMRAETRIAVESLLLEAVELAAARTRFKRERQPIPHVET